MSSLREFLEKKVRIISTDARLFEGILQGFDSSTNIIVSGCIERVIYPEDDDEENQEIPLGLYVMRGGNVVCIGEVDDAVELDWSAIRGAELKDTKNPL
ncbi:U6 snRNA-associated Sm-like protein LSm8 [[Candida] zeylanoides]